MGKISKAIRNRRFNLVTGHPITFQVKTLQGSTVNLILENCALRGLGAKCSDRENGIGEINVNDLLPSSQMGWEGHEYTLGRLVVRFKKETDNEVLLGLSPIDTVVPVTGAMSKFLDRNFNEDTSPYSFEIGYEKFTVADFYADEDLGSDIFDKAHRFSIFYKDWSKAKKYSYMNVRMSSKGSRVSLDRPRKGGRTDYLVMASNDYLGLASHPKVIEAAEKALRDYGLGSTGAPVVTGLTDIHMELEAEIAHLYGKPKAILYNTGYAANQAAISSLVGTNDIVLGDLLSHGSMQIGMELAKGAKRFFRHNSVSHLERLLEEIRPEHAGCLVLTEGVFSMDGDEAPLDQLIEVCHRHNARLYVDEAHSFGVLGKTGLGAVEKYGVIKEIDLIMGNFSKMTGAMGGFITGPKEVIELLRYTSLNYIQSTYLPPSVAAGALAALRVFRSEPEIYQGLKRNIVHFRDGLNQLGFNFSKDHESAVFPLVIRDEAKIGIMKEVLYDNGIYVAPIVYPSVSKKNARFRFCLMSTHSVAEIDFALTIIEKAMAAAKFDPRKLRNDVSNET